MLGRAASASLQTLEPQPKPQKICTAEQAKAAGSPYFHSLCHKGMICTCSCCIYCLSPSSHATVTLPQTGEYRCSCSVHTGHAVVQTRLIFTASPTGSNSHNVKLSHIMCIRAEQILTAVVLPCRSRFFMEKGWDGFEAAPAGGDSRNDNMRPGDWSCPDCNQHNFARNTECYKCGAPKT